MNQSESVRSPKLKQNTKIEMKQIHNTIDWQQIAGVMRNKTDTKTENAKRWYVYVRRQLLRYGSPWPVPELRHLPTWIGNFECESRFQNYPGFGSTKQCLTSSVWPVNLVLRWNKWKKLICLIKTLCTQHIHNFVSPLLSSIVWFACVTVACLERIQFVKWERRVYMPSPCAQFTSNINKQWIVRRSDFWFFLSSISYSKVCYF